MVDGDRVLPEAAGRLDHQHHVAGLHCGDDDFAVGIVAAVDEQLSRRRPPVPLHGLGELVGQGGEPFAVILGGHPNRVAGELALGEPVGVLSAAFDQRVDQRVAVGVLDTGQVAHLIPVIAHGPQQRDGAGRGVQADRVADAGVLGGIRREHQGHPFVGGGDMPQLRVSHRQTRDPRAALRVGDIGDQPVVVNLFERERNCDDAAVEFGHGDLTGHIERAEAVIVGIPLAAGAGQTQALQDRDIQGRKVFDVPAVVIATGGDRGGLQSPGGQHGDHHRVRVAESLQQVGFGGAQRRAVDGQRPRARIFDRPAQRLDVGGVAG